MSVLAVAAGCSGGRRGGNAAPGNRAPASRQAIAVATTKVSASNAATRPATATASEDRAQRDRTAKARLDIANIETAVQAFELDCGRFPTTEEGLEALVTKPQVIQNWHGPYLRDLPKDPWGQAYVYRYPSMHEGVSFEMFSPGPDGIAGNEDDIGNWEQP